MAEALTKRVCVLHEDYDVRIHRPGKWGNPFPVGPTGYTRPEAVRRYRDHVLGTPNLRRQLHRLYGKRLGCFCKPGELCHGDVLVELAEQVHHTGTLPKRTGFFKKR